MSLVVWISTSFVQLLDFFLKNFLELFDDKHALKLSSYDVLSENVLHIYVEYLKVVKEKIFQVIQTHGQQLR